MKNILDWLNRWLKIMEQRVKLKDKAIETKKLNTTTKQRKKQFEGKFEALRYESVQHTYNWNPRMKDIGKKYWVNTSANWQKTFVYIYNKINELASKIIMKKISPRHIKLLRTNEMEKNLEIRQRKAC